MTREEWLQVRISAAEKAAMMEAARLNGQSLSDWIRQIARKAAAKELREAGLNQLILALR